MHPEGDWGYPDYRTNPSAFATSVTLSGGRKAVWRGTLVVDGNLHSPHMARQTNSASAIGPGHFYSRVSLFPDGGEAESHVSELGASWIATPADGNRGLFIDSDQTGYVYFHEPIPTGYTGRLYLTQADQKVDTFGLFVSGIAAGTRKVQIAGNTWEDPDQLPPACVGWVCDYLLPEDQIVPYGATLTFSAPAGLLTDEYGNATEAVSNASIPNYSRVNSDGSVKLDYTLTGGRRKWFIAANGSDSNDGVTAATPKQTLAGASPGHGDHVFVRRGDTWTMTQHRLWDRNGASFDQPFIFASYWDAEVDGPAPTNDYGEPLRAIVVTGDANLNALQISAATTRPPRDNVIIHGLDFRHFEPLHDGPGSVPSAITWNAGGKYSMVAECRAEHWHSNFTFPGAVVFQTASNDGAFYLDTFCLYRLISVDSHQHGTNAFAQGLRWDNARDIEIAQCVFVRTSYLDDTFEVGGGEQRSHPAYGNWGGLNNLLWGNAILDGCHLGFMVRGGGTVTKCVFNRVSTSVALGGYGGTVSYCASLSPWDKLFSSSGGNMCYMLIATGLPVTTHTLLEHCVGADAERVGAEHRRFYNFTRYDASDAGQKHAIKAERFVERNNVGHEMGPGRFDTYPVLMTGGRSIFYTTGSPNGQLVRLNTSTAYEGNHLYRQTDENVYYSDEANWVNSQYADQNGGLAKLQELSGAEANSIVFLTEFVNPDYDREDLAADYGWADAATMVARWRDRGVGVWGAQWNPELGFGHAAPNFMATNLPSLGSGDWDYYGAVDYREGLPELPTYQATGDSTVEVDSPLTITVTPSESSTETLTTHVVQGSAVVAPSLTWDDDQPREATATPTAAGVTTVAFKRGSTTVASHTFNATSPQQPGGTVPGAFFMAVGVILLEVPE